MVLSVVPESTAANRVDDNEKDEKYNVHNSNLLPVALNIIKQPSLASLAIEAQNIGIIFPQITVRIGRVCSSPVPDNWAHISEIAVIGRFTATRLHVRTKIRN